MNYRLPHIKVSRTVDFISRKYWWKTLRSNVSGFVRKDARNWDEYVPYAIVAYRAMPHCSTKYSPYYLVYGRDMRPPIEEDWEPQLTNKNAEET